MESITFEIESNSEIVDLFDKSIDTFFVHKFDPHPSIEWFDLDINSSKGLKFKDLNVRSMEFDLQTDLKGLKHILTLNTNQLRVYQFATSVPDTLVLEHLPEENRMRILKNNGLKHFFWIDFEFITIESFDSAFIKAIIENPIFKDRIEKRRQDIKE